MDTSDSLQEWYKLRHRTMVIGLLHKSIFIFEYSSVSISALYYYQHSIENENPQLYYSLCMGVVYLVALFSSFHGGKYIDRTGNLREIVLMTIFLSICGNALYLISYSKWFPIIGRALCGLAEGARPGFAGECFLFVFAIKESGTAKSLYVDNPRSRTFLYVSNKMFGHLCAIESILISHCLILKKTVGFLSRSFNLLPFTVDYP